MRRFKFRRRKGVGVEQRAAEGLKDEKTKRPEVPRSDFSGSGDGRGLMKYRKAEMLKLET
jgi:hypothetical protein